MRIKSLNIFLILIIFFCTHLLYAQDMKAPDFALKDINDKTFALSDFKGKNVILFFWAIQCPYCIDEMKKMLSRCSELISEDLRILAINVGDSKKRLDNFFKSKSICFDVLLDSRASVAYIYDLAGVPAFFIIDKDGFLRYSGYRMPRKLDEYLKK